MSEVELVLAFLAGVVMGGALDRFVLPLTRQCLDRPTASAWAMSEVTTRTAAGPMSTPRPGSAPLPRSRSSWSCFSSSTSLSRITTSAQGSSCPSWARSVRSWDSRPSTSLRGRSTRAVKLCTVCGVVTSRPGSRCGQHPRLSGLGANHHIHADPRWTHRSKRMIARHVGQHGYVVQVTIERWHSFTGRHTERIEACRPRGPPREHGARHGLATRP